MYLKIKIKKLTAVLIGGTFLSATLSGQNPILVNGGLGGIHIWTSPPTNYEEGIHLTNNVKLTISGNTWAFNENAKIEVDAGCQLTIDNSAVLTDNNNNNKWLGIEANGDYSKDQFIPGGKPNNNIKKGNAGASAAWEGSLEPDQAQVFINANCLIINAECGVRANLGAIIRATGATFLNNQVGIHVFKYKSFGHPEINASYMMECKFIWDYLNPNFNNSELKGIHLQVVRGVNIGGCEFTNNFTSRSNYTERSVGILCDYSTMHASKSGNMWCDDDDGCPDNCYNSNSKNNFFNYLYSGITITSGSYIPVAIRNSNFTNCKTGIEIANGWGCVITKCNFTATVLTMEDKFTNWTIDNAELRHIRSVNSTGLTIYDNDFNYNSINIHSIHVEDVGIDRSRVTKNRINNTQNNTNYYSNVFGLTVHGDCRGLEANCNTFTSQGVDIYIAAGASCYNTFSIPNNGTGPVILSPEGQGLSNNFSAYNPVDRYRILIAYTAGPGYLPSSAGFLGSTRYIHKNGAGSIQVPPTIKGKFPDPLSEDYFALAISSAATCDLTCSQLSSVEKYQKHNLIKIYPNPTIDGKVKIELENHLFLETMIIYNALGQKLDEIQINEMSKIIDLEIQDKGIYFVRITDKSNRIMTEKLIFN
jgi:hypothetical protein